MSGLQKAKSIFISALPLLIFVGLGIFFYIRLYGGDPATLPSALINKPAPAFSLPQLLKPGEKASDAVFKNGKVTVLNVWASWCGPCRTEHPLLISLREQIKDKKNVQLVGLNYKDKPTSANKFLNELGNPFDIIIADETGRTGIDFGVYGVPETFVIDEKGIIRLKLVGELTRENIKTKILPLIKNPSK